MLKRVLGIGIFSLLVSTLGYAQCDQQVWDNTNTLSSSQVAQISAAAKPLVDQQADVHVIVTSLSSGTLDTFIGNLGRNCSTWKSPNGGIKANMLILAVAPKERKMGIFYGPGYSSVLNGQIDRIKRDYMAPYFKGADWVGGFVATEEALATKIKASLDESNKPITNETVNQATDMGGFWVFLWVLGGLLFIGLVIYVIMKVGKAKEEKEKAQQDAIASRSRVVDLLDSLGEQLKTADQKSSGCGQAVAIVDLVSRQFTNIASNQSGDPTESGMSASFYQSLDTTFRGLEQKLLLAETYLKAGFTPSVSKSTSKKAKKRTVGYSESISEPTPPAPITTPQEKVVVVDNSSGSDLLSGVVLGELASRPTYKEPDPEPEPKHHSSSDDSSSSSSSSSDSWGGSSSSFDSGSSWDSSSSSSDFGGSDSGGGLGGDSSSF